MTSRDADADEDRDGSAERLERSILGRPKPSAFITQEQRRALQEQERISRTLRRDGYSTGTDGKKLKTVVERKTAVDVSTWRDKVESRLPKVDLP